MNARIVRLTLAGSLLAGSVRAQGPNDTTIVITPTPAPVRTETISTVPNRALLSTGAGMVFGAYAPSFLVAATSKHEGDNNLFVPVVGPWLDLAQRDCQGVQTSRCGTTPLEGFGLVADGIIQGVGAFGIIASFFVPDHTMTIRRPSPAGISVVPTTFRGTGGGVFATGTF